METIIEIVSMFLFVQFLVVVTMMSTALLLTKLKPEVPLLGREPGSNHVSRSSAAIKSPL